MMIDLSRQPGDPMDGMIWTARSWPGWRIFWLWLRQGRPVDRPVVVRRGTYTADAPASGESKVTNVHFVGWTFDTRMMPSGIYPERAFYDVLYDYPCDVRLPSGLVVRGYLGEDES